MPRTGSSGGRGHRVVWVGLVTLLCLTCAGQADARTLGGRSGGSGSRGGSGGGNPGGGHRAGSAPAPVPPAAGSVTPVVAVTGPPLGRGPSGSPTGGTSGSSGASAGSEAQSIAGSGQPAAQPRQPVCVTHHNVVTWQQVVTRIPARVCGELIKGIGGPTLRRIPAVVTCRRPQAVTTCY
jgi:hypothetical protein